MTPNEWAAFVVAISTLIGSLAIGVRHLVKHYLVELKSNGGTSLRDKVDLLEQKVELLTELVKEAIKK